MRDLLSWWDVSLKAGKRSPIRSRAQAIAVRGSVPGLRGMAGNRLVPRLQVLGGSEFALAPLPEEAGRSKLKGKSSLSSAP